MKKFYVMLGLLLIVNASYAQERPKWDMLCPQGMENASYKEIHWYWPDSTKSTQELYNYWAKRREEFKENLIKCDVMDENIKQSCYKGLIDKEKNNRELYSTNLHKQYMSKQIWKDTNKINNWVMINILPQ